MIQILNIALFIAGYLGHSRATTGKHSMFTLDAAEFYLCNSHYIKKEKEVDHKLASQHGPAIWF
jgi:hypothetical protein